ncbi:MAG: amidophosphoribosyltransferase [Crocinitomicaceae bacterium]|nr:amidophosphoribosyltransferase [Crocinitomicaceae bacterium]|tara:strand:- start:2911 stop:4803 length:1893 start_codon:yes stop_codon:yes gene_type:complete
MSDFLTHECGIALLRLKKPLQYYINKYGTAFYALNKMYLLMEKQHNRGQDGAGIANIKLDVSPGKRYISRMRSVDNKPIQDTFGKIMGRFKHLSADQLNDADFLQQNFAFTGELSLGHLRYGTYGKNDIENCHPFLRQNNWRTRNLVVAGNFNMTNVDELFDVLIEIGQHPKQKSDTVTVLEKMGHYLDVENQKRFDALKAEGLDNRSISEKIADTLDLGGVLRSSASDFDGGYAMCGLLGHGDAFVLRDPNGIRPAYWYEDDEIVVASSERPVIQTAFNVKAEKVVEVSPGHALIIRRNGSTKLEKVIEPRERTACSFERIYFSRGNDKDIYEERKALGEGVVPQVLEAVEHDLDNTVVSFIPNTAEVCFYGLIKGLEDKLNRSKIERIKGLGSNPSSEDIESILSEKARAEKVTIKDAKLRTFISEDKTRDDLVAHVYDIAYGTIKPGVDNLVVIDDSIVRGTTLKKSILKILDRLSPKRIVVASSAPQIRYPDCYGIDMAKMGDFIAFQAAIALLVEKGMGHILDETYEACLKELEKPLAEIQNPVTAIYEPFSANEVSDKISELLTPEGMVAEVKIIFQSIEGLHKACPDHTGDWYFTGNYPTPGGRRVVNKAFVYFMEGCTERAY